MTLLLWNILVILGALAVAAMIVGIALFIRWGNRKNAVANPPEDEVPGNVLP